MNQDFQIRHGSKHYRPCNQYKHRFHYSHHRSLLGGRSVKRCFCLKYWAKNNTIWKDQQWSEGKIIQKLLFNHFTFFCQLCMALSFPIYSIVLWDKTDSLMSFSQFMLKKVLKKRLNFHEKKTLETRGQNFCFFFFLFKSVSKSIITYFFLFPSLLLWHISNDK